MPDPIITYPFDPTGVLETNKIFNEQHTTTESNFRDYYFIVPNFAPFFADTVVVNYTYQGITRTLIKDIDYYCALMFVSATRATGKPVYGAITLNNLNAIGIISLTYNTVGGDWNVDQHYVIEQIAEKAYNPRTVAWEHVVGAPSNFPPIPHAWDLVDLVGQTEVVAALSEIETAILNSNDNEWAAHSSKFDNPHNVTKTQLGLSNVENWTIATNTEVELGVSNDTLITPKNLDVKLDTFYTKEEISVILEAFKASIEQSKINRAKLYFLAQN